MYDLIEKKKRGDEHSADEINFIVHGVTDGSIPDYQVSAWLMAVYFKGMTDKETSLLTDAMAHSGDMIDLSRFGTLTVDKHSTGGVGDKTSLVITPIVAALGAKVAKMSGRGLGHTGGTVDKLESLTGYRTALSVDEFLSQVEEIGIALVGQSGNLAPADKKLYALRDVTATVNSIPLIASSIMSKKLAAGTRSIVLDVKCGSGAFMNTPELARELAEAMVAIGKSRGRRTAAVITNMDLPLGHAIGNAIEVKEAIEVLTGKGPDDLREVCLKLASVMLSLSLGITEEEGLALAVGTLESGKAYGKFCEWIALQGGDAAYAKDPSLFGESLYEREIKAGRDGYILSCNAEAIGIAAMKLGAGRETKDDLIEFKAGIRLIKKPCDRVEATDTVAVLYTDKKDALDEAEKIVLNALTFTDCVPERAPMIIATVF